MKIVLDNKVLDSIDMNYANPTVFFNSTSGFDHYRLLVYLSQQFRNVTFIDLGTREGGSAVALGYCLENKVLSFDINPNIQPASRVNISYHTGNALEEKWHSVILASPLISLDTEHDGIFERQVLDFLVEHDYKGMLYMDDIKTNNYPLMIKFWENIKLRKVDVTKYGHFTGSGLVLFNNDTEIIMQ